MEFIEVPLAGAYLIKPRKIEDHRGFFARSWCQAEFSERGLTKTMVQMNVGYSTKQGTLRGMHYQEDPHQEAKLIRCTRGAIYDVIVDLRAGSATRGEWYGAELTADNGLMLYAPEGFAHGYQTLSDGAEMFYMTSAFYAAGAARGVRYDDPVFSIRWPLPVSVISAADQKWPDFVPDGSGR